MKVTLINPEDYNEYEADADIDLAEYFEKLADFVDTIELPFF